MTLNARGLTDRIVSHAAATGRFESVNRHEPKSSPGSGITASVWFSDLMGVSSSGLASTSALVVFNVRIQQNMLTEPQDDIDPDMLDALDTLIDAYSGDFELGGNVRCVDLLGMTGTRLRAQGGYFEHDRKMFRAILITLPLVVNDVWVQAP